MTVYNITGITGGSMAAFQGALKEQYFPRWNDMINPEARLWSMIAKNTVNGIGGIQTLFSVMDRHVASAGMPLLEDQVMASPTAPRFVKPAIWPKDHYARVRSTGHAERAAKAGDTATYIAVMKEQLRSAREQHHLMRNIEAYLGVLSPFAQLSAYAHDGSGLHTVDPRNNRTSAADGRWISGTKYLVEGFAYNIVSGSGSAPVQQGAPTWTNVDGANERVILSIIDDTSFVGTTAGGTTGANDPSDYSAGATANGALVIAYGSRITGHWDTTDDADADSKSGHGNGLATVLGNATTKAFVYSLDKASYPFLNSIYDANSGTLRDWDENELTFVFDQSAESRYNKGGRMDVVMMGRAVRREYIRETKGDRQFSPVLKEKGWGPKLQYTAGDVSAMIEVDRHCPDFLAFGLQTSSFKRYVNTPLGMMDRNHEDRFRDGRDSHEIPLVESDNLMCLNPQGNAQVEDINGSTTGLL